jgi:hypothetical protein
MRKSLAIITSLFLAFLVTSANAKEAEEKQFKLSCVLFDHKSNQIALSGHVGANKFKEWFKRDYPVAAERIETPKHATAFGVLVLTDGADILAMPCYTWRAGELTYFACQSQEIGRAPMFTVIETSQQAFINSMNERLNEIGKAEQVAP